MTKNKKCPRCDKVKSTTNFYKRRRGTQPSVYCKPCTIEQTLERQRKFKHQCIEYKGGKCERCNYDRCDSALEFHHVNPTNKDFSIGHAKLTSFNDRIKKELDKCILVCANCHREEHFKLHNK
jgi:hypothetical protein